ncbi:unnamed protein product [Polarella glacialis]|uniref:Uncharacterized protein n=1 Tax=Polarella glacialis TaxID=89957 RepID=A0A813JT63_POLGL|nr:unnamed protein product [Polarella glacialis]
MPLDHGVYMVLLCSIDAHAAAAIAALRGAPELPELCLEEVRRVRRLAATVPRAQLLRVRRLRLLALTSRVLARLWSGENCDWGPAVLGFLEHCLQAASGTHWTVGRLLAELEGMACKELLKLLKLLLKPKSGFLPAAVALMRRQALAFWMLRAGEVLREDTTRPFCRQGSCYFCEVELEACAKSQKEASRFSKRMRLGAEDTVIQQRRPLKLRRRLAFTSPGLLGVCTAFAVATIVVGWEGGEAEGGLGGVATNRSNPFVGQQPRASTTASHPLLHSIAASRARHLGALMELTGADARAPLAKPCVAGSEERENTLQAACVEKSTSAGEFLKAEVVGKGEPAGPLECVVAVANARDVLAEFADASSALADAKAHAFLVCEHVLSDFTGTSADTKLVFAAEELSHSLELPAGEQQHQEQQQQQLSWPAASTGCHKQTRLDAAKVDLKAESSEPSSPSDSGQQQQQSQPSSLSANSAASDVEAGAENDSGLPVRSEWSAAAATVAETTSPAVTEHGYADADTDMACKEESPEFADDLPEKLDLELESGDSDALSMSFARHPEAKTLAKSDVVEWNLPLLPELFGVTTSAALANPEGIEEVVELAADASLCCEHWPADFADAPSDTTLVASLDGPDYSPEEVAGTTVGLKPVAFKVDGARAWQALSTGCAEQAQIEESKEAVKADVAEAGSPEQSDLFAAVAAVAETTSPAVTEFGSDVDADADTDMVCKEESPEFADDLPEKLDLELESRDSDALSMSFARHPEAKTLVKSDVAEWNLPSLPELLAATTTVATVANPEGTEEVVELAADASPYCEHRHADFADASSETTLVGSLEEPGFSPEEVVGTTARLPPVASWEDGARAWQTLSTGCAELTETEESRGAVKAEVAEAGSPVRSEWSAVVQVGGVADWTASVHEEAVKTEVAEEGMAWEHKLRYFTDLSLQTPVSHASEELGPLVALSGTTVEPLAVSHLAGVHVQTWDASAVSETGSDDGLLDVADATSKTLSQELERTDSNVSCKGFSDQPPSEDSVKAALAEVDSPNLSAWSATFANAVLAELSHSGREAKSPERRTLRAAPLADTADPAENEAVENAHAEAGVAWETALGDFADVFLRTPVAYASEELGPIVAFTELLTEPHLGGMQAWEASAVREPDSDGNADVGLADGGSLDVAHTNCMTLGQEVERTDRNVLPVGTSDQPPSGDFVDAAAAEVDSPNLSAWSATFANAVLAELSHSGGEAAQSIEFRTSCTATLAAAAGPAENEPVSHAEDGACMAWDTKLADFTDNNNNHNNNNSNSNNNMFLQTPVSYASEVLGPFVVLAGTTVGPLTVSHLADVQIQAWEASTVSELG